MADPLDPRVDSPDAPGSPLGLVPIIDYDLRDLNFPLSTVLPDVEIPTSKYWTPGSPWDQQNEGACVGFGVGKSLYMYPIQTKVVEGLSSSPLGFGIYHQAKTFDGYPGEGTSLHAGMDVVNGRTGWKDRVFEYRWVWDYDTAMQWLLTGGSLVAGIPWYVSFDIGPKSSMVKMPKPAGGIRGYHCIPFYGGNRNYMTMRTINSWDGHFGYYGKAIFTRDVLEPILFSDLGAGCMAIVEQKVA